MLKHQKLFRAIPKSLNSKAIISSCPTVLTRLFPRRILLSSNNVGILISFVGSQVQISRPGLINIVWTKGPVSVTDSHMDFNWWPSLRNSQPPVGSTIYTRPRLKQTRPQQAGSEEHKWRPNLLSWDIRDSIKHWHTRYLA